MAQGMNGFAGADFGLALGHVDGYRWWKLAAPNLLGSPAHADRDWTVESLIGANEFRWQPGVNEAVCSTDPSHEPPVERFTRPRLLPGDYVPAQDQCGCGFWAYWEPQEHPITGNENAYLPVLGIVRGTGRTLIGPRGFRSQQARIIALHLPFQIVRTDPLNSTPGDGWHDAFSQPGVHHPPHGRPSFARGGLLSTPASRQNGKNAMAEFDRYLRHGRYQPAPPEPEETDAHALAWTAVIEDRLATMYGAELYTTRAALTASHPPDTRYLPPPAAACTCDGPVQAALGRCPVHMTMAL
jgi:hypothetical protein